ncbi:MAG TPA: substrate-binding domain-containing protein [Sphingobacteriaceae bacterium]
MKNWILTLGLAISICGLSSCGSSPEANKTYTTGSTKVLVDETFKPILEDQLAVFDSEYPAADIDALYKSENELLKDFLTGDIRVAVLSRLLNDEEKNFYENKKINIRVRRFAVDGIALITHKSAEDSTATVEDIINVLRGNPGKIRSLVFDNPNSSTVRYLKEVAGVKELPSQGVYALKSNPEVIRYVNDHPGTIGVTGINWIRQPEEGLEQIIPNLKVLGVRNLPGKPGSDDFYKPTQSNIALKRYPLTRNLYIMNAQGGPGLGSGLAAFLYGERGQRIVLKSGLLPDSIPPREIRIIK